MMKKYELAIKRSGNGSFLLKMEVPDSEIRLMEFIPLMYQLYDKIIESELVNYTDISCRKSCGECCKQLVPIIIPEALFLTSLIKSFSHKKQVQINSRFTKILNTIKTAGFFDNLKNPARNRNIDNAYFNLKVKCPFLENESCTIYKSRPFACREYYVTTKPEYCADPYQNEIDKIKIKRNIGSMMAAFTARLYMSPPIPIPMILLSEWVRENTNLGTRKWSGVWLFDKMMSALITLNDEEFEIMIS
jgi:Fe-S-cluster containining protein